MKDELLYADKELLISNNNNRFKELTIPSKKHSFNCTFFLRYLFILMVFLIIFQNKTKDSKVNNKINIENIKQRNLLYTDNNKFINTLNKNTNQNALRQKTIAVVFAGRQRYLELLLRYLMNLKNNNKIDEIHFWQFTNVKEDEEYLNSIANLHRTTGGFIYFRSIYPLIENNAFNISIKQEKENGGGVLLINDKYEITFKQINKLFMEISIKKGNHFFSNRQKNIYNPNEFSNYTIQINNKEIIIFGKNDFYMKCSIEDNNLNSVKIHSTKDSITIWDYEESINKDLKIYDSLFRAYNHWYESYKFYLDYDFDIILKIDDDITFIDFNRFDEFIDYIKLFKKNVTFPNLINQAVSVYYNNKYGLVPDNIIDKKYRNKPSPLKIFDYYKDGKQSAKIHEYFLDNVDKFINNTIEPINLNGQKPSISMFGMSKEAYNKVYSPQAIWKKSYHPKDYYFSDEPYTYGLLNNYVYSRFICAHFAFGPQRKSGLNESLLERYEKLANEYIK